MSIHLDPRDRPPFSRWYVPFDIQHILSRCRHSQIATINNVLEGDTLSSSLETCSMTKRNASDRFDELLSFEEIRVDPAIGTNCRNSTFREDGLGV